MRYGMFTSYYRYARFFAGSFHNTQKEQTSCQA